MNRRFPHFLLQPSIGDQLVAGVRTAKIILCRLPGFPTECSVELRSTIDQADMPAIAAGLAAEFSKPLPHADEQLEEGGELCG